MKKRERQTLIKEICAKIKEINDLESLARYYNGHNYDGELFDFDLGDYCFTISTNQEGKIYLVNNVDVFDKQGNYRGNYTINVEEY